MHFPLDVRWERHMAIPQCEQHCTNAATYVCGLCSAALCRGHKHTLTLAINLDPEYGEHLCESDHFVVCRGCAHQAMDDFKDAAHIG